MSEATNASAVLKTKLVQLQLTTKRTEGILAKSDEESITRHLGTLRTVVSEVDKLRLTVEGKKSVMTRTQPSGTRRSTAKLPKQIAMYVERKNG
jgi:hypothetical protein